MISEISDMADVESKRVCVCAVPLPENIELENQLQAREEASQAAMDTAEALNLPIILSPSTDDEQGVPMNQEANTEATAEQFNGEEETTASYAAKEAGSADPCGIDADPSAVIFAAANENCDRTVGDTTFTNSEPPADCRAIRKSKKRRAANKSLKDEQPAESSSCQLLLVHKWKAKPEIACITLQACCSCVITAC